MRFVDEATIKVQAGNGGRGAASFRREKFIPFGGPDGGDGGKGADIYLVGRAGINTLADFRYNRAFRAPHGTAGSGNDCTGASGTDLVVEVPIGTVVVDVDTEEQLGDITEAGQRLLVGKGGIGANAVRISPAGPNNRSSLMLHISVFEAPFCSILSFCNRCCGNE